MKCIILETKVAWIQYTTHRLGRHELEGNKFEYYSLVCSKIVQRFFEAFKTSINNLEKVNIQLDAQDVYSNYNYNLTYLLL